MGFMYFEAHKIFCFLRPLAATARFLDSLKKKGACLITKGNGCRGVQSCLSCFLFMCKAELMLQPVWLHLKSCKASGPREITWNYFFFIFFLRELLVVGVVG